MSGMQPHLKTADPWETRAARLQRYMQDTIPQVRHMQAHVVRCDAAGLGLSAPLAPNINHERTAFGGSLASLATLACWGYLWLLLEDRPGMHMVVNEAQIRYLKPVSGDLNAWCPAPAEKDLKKFMDTLERRGRARLSLRAEFLGGETLLAEYSGSFVAYTRD
ncbi:MAG TPA: YiiD C-terminal domain-containing protein [Gammaproteobacteria bacterium]|nr:YiiD C-terminal domain-containing protein [Gammaproteobacteria bacterium]